MPLTAKIEENIGFWAQRKSSTTHHTERNIMASPTQTVVGKGKTNLLIAEDLLKILRELVPHNPTKIFYQLFFIEW